MHSSASHSPRMRSHAPASVLVLVGVFTVLAVTGPSYLNSSTDQAGPSVANTHASVSIILGNKHQEIIEDRRIPAAAPLKDNLAETRLSTPVVISRDLDHNENKSAIVGFYHVAMMNSWEQVVLSQMDNLKTSGLLAATQDLHVSLLGPKDRWFSSNRSQLLLTADKNIHMHFIPNLESWEYPTLDRMRNHCVQRPQDYVYYLHSKGVTKDPGTVEFEREQLWRSLMEHFVLHDWRSCLQAMQISPRKFACGIGYKDRPAPHFSGNFFWSACRHVKNLNPPGTTVSQEVVGKWMSEGNQADGINPQKARWFAEYWLLDAYHFVKYPIHEGIINCLDNTLDMYRDKFHMEWVSCLTCSNASSRVLKNAGVLSNLCSRRR